MVNATRFRCDEKAHERCSSQEAKMTYFPDDESAKSSSPYNYSTQCFGCGDKLSGPTVRYDGYSERGVGSSVFFHRDCAFAMAQRLILDTWPNRRDGKAMTNSC